MRKFLTIFFFLFVYQTIFAQNGTITGKVIDESGQPLPRANITVLSTELGAATNSEGEYTIQEMFQGDIFG
ncbi:MAG: carboxypeptidase-like regulatory domain-containing protein [Ignavibacteriales bacterium]|nr:carboxypeptidase-like regulatory domain-containing protein [Ignavibacteriales bacterium]